MTPTSTVLIFNPRKFNITSYQCYNGSGEPTKRAPQVRRGRTGRQIPSPEGRRKSDLEIRLY
jgi:hypothetical protein